MLAGYRARIASSQRRSDAEPANTQLQDEFARVHQSCAETLQNIVAAPRDQSDGRAILQHYQASLGIRERIVQADQNNAAWHRNLLIAHKKVGDVLRDQGKLAAARESYRAAIPIAERLAQVAPRHVRPQLDLYFVYAGLAVIEVRQKERCRALDVFRSGRAVIARLKAKLPDDPNWPIYLDWIDGEIAKLEG
jgi:hypothetical protein